MHVRYETVEGAFRRGGFVSHHWSKDGNQFTQLVFDKFKRADDGTNPSWAINHVKTSRIWKKIGFDRQLDMHTFNSDQFAGDVRTMAIEMKKMQQRIFQLEENQKKLVKIIKKKG